VLEHGIQRMKQPDGDHDQRLLGRFALGLLAKINGAPLATPAHGIDGGEVERMARQALLEDVRSALRPYNDDTGIAVPNEAHVAVGHT